MATLVDTVQIMSEETPRPEGAVTTTPYRLSSGNVLWLPGQSARLSPNTQLLDRSDEMRGIEGGVPQLLDGYDPDGAISIRAYGNALTWLLNAVGLTGTHTAGGAAIADGFATTTVTGVNALNSATINVASTALFASSGSILIGGSAITYTGKTETSFTGCGAHAATTGGETVTQQVPTGANKWVFAKRGGITAKTFQMILAYVDEALFLKGQGCGVSNLSMTSDGNVSADLQALVVGRVADPNLTPAYDTSAIPHFRRGDMTLQWNVAGGSGTTEDFSFAISNPLNKRRTLTLNPPSYFPDQMEHGDDRVRLTGSIPKTSIDTDDYDALVSAASFSAKAIWRSPKVIGATAAFYTLALEMPACQYTGGGPAEIANRRRHGMPLDFWAAWDETAGYDFRITLVNGVTAAQWETLV